MGFFKIGLILAWKWRRMTQCLPHKFGGCFARFLDSVLRSECHFLALENGHLCQNLIKLYILTYSNARYDHLPFSHLWFWPKSYRSWIILLPIKPMSLINSSWGIHAMHSDGNETHPTRDGTEQTFQPVTEYDNLWNTSQKYMYVLNLLQTNLSALVLQLA